jgi:glycolate oxidase iron-sulfur subunit
MQTSIADSIRHTPQGHEADAILRSCVHCGFCLATCPTYQLLGDELDSPRGRIYLIKQVLEGHAPTAKTQLHLDRCLTCRACETTCPSGVRYGRLLDIGRELVESKVERPLLEKFKHKLLRALIPHPARFAKLLGLGQIIRQFLPDVLRRRIPARANKRAWTVVQHSRSMLVLKGCAQSAVAPDINVATAHVLDKLGITLTGAPGAGCCGALSYHLTAPEEARMFARRNIDAWWPAIVAGAESIVLTASGCGVFVKDYGTLLRDDPHYASKAAHVALICKDISEVLINEDISRLVPKQIPQQKIAFHSPCTLQHGQKLNGITETLLTKLGFSLTDVPDAHLCCGSAGAYSILQKKLSQQLLEGKLKALQSGSPDLIATANIGCLIHLQSRAAVPVRHWIELLD